MPDLIASAFYTPGLICLVVAAFVAGVVRGFSGFGTAMIFLPVAGQWLAPFEAITVLIAMDMIGPIPNIPRAMRDGRLPDVGRMAVGMLIALPVGIYVLTLVAPEVFRYAVSILTGLLLALLILGVRYKGTLSRPIIYGTGVASGFLGGAVGVGGPPVIMLYMASTIPAKVIRANITLYLVLLDLAMLGMIWMFGRMSVSAFVVGLVVAVPYLIGNVTGAGLFRENAERIYRMVAYTIIAISALSGLPVFD